MRERGEVRWLYEVPTAVWPEEFIEPPGNVGPRLAEPPTDGVIDMVTVGIILNIIAILTISFLCYWLVPIIFTK